MIITLPLPVSDNERLIVAWKQRRMIASKKYRDYMDIAKTDIYNQIVRQSNRYILPLIIPTFKNQLKIYITFYLKDKRRDAMDMMKCLLDCMKDNVYSTDKWVVPIVSYPYLIDHESPHVEVRIDI